MCRAMLEKNLSLFVRKAEIQLELDKHLDTYKNSQNGIKHFDVMTSTL